MTDPTEALMLQFLAFVPDGGRSYGEVMEAWRTSCPRMTIWEDALIEELVRIEHLDGTARTQSRVILTARGRARLADQTEVALAPLVSASEIVSARALRAGGGIR
jgi:hypothetical protein